MLRRFSVNFAILSIALDLMVIGLGLWIGVKIRPLLNALPFASEVGQNTHIPLFLYLFFPAVWVLIFILLSVYDGRRNLKVIDELNSITLGSVLAAVSLAGTLYLSYRDTSRVLFLSFVLIGFTLVITWRSASRLFFRAGMQGISNRKVLVIGAGPVGRQLQAQIIKNPHLGLSLVGFLDDDLSKHSLYADILGALDDVRTVVVSEKIDDVVIALPQRAYERVNQLTAELHNLPVKVWVIPDYFQLALHRAVVEEFAGLPMLDLRAPALNDYQRMVKRCFDLVITMVIAPPALILMGFIAILIWIEDRGEVLFLQDRVGENGRLFKMMKFRTMVPDAEALRYLVEIVDEQGHLIHKRENDPRVTRVGRVLRRTSLDELPQLFNIIKGDMSLVGPRPELPYLVDQYEPWQRKRFAVPQGITGWWQVNGRSDRPMHLHTEDDLYYVQHYSLMLDIFILIKTVAVVFRGKGAY